LPWQPRGVETYPVHVGERVIAVIERLPSSAIRVVGRLEEEYLRIADELFALIVTDGFPPVEQVQRATGTVRVGDGLMRVDASGVTTYASPNAVSACRRLSWSGDVVGASLRTMVQRIAQRHGPVDDQIIQLVSGRIAGRADIEHGDITLLVRVVPMRLGALILLRDVTETRRRERELLTKDATIREIHHRVKNNLQTVAALLRLQGRRAQGDEAREVLREAQLRIGAIAVVHDLLATGGAADVPFAEVVDRIIGLLRDLAPAFGPNEITVTRDGDCGSLPTDITTPLAMATMELLQNAFEHAGAKHIEVHLGQPSGDIRVEVRDDGVGISTPAPRDGLGLQIVESLITSELRGTFTIEAMTHGTRACLDVPMS
jgi:two-component sensor histidine kinase